MIAPEPVYTPVVPRGPLKLRKGARLCLRAAYDVAGLRYLAEEVRRVLVEEVGPRASSPHEVAALRRWVDLEVPLVTEPLLRGWESCAVQHEAPGSP